jgi:hypothetical protein
MRQQWPSPASKCTGLRRRESTSGSFPPGRLTSVLTYAKIHISIDDALWKITLYSAEVDSMEYSILDCWLTCRRAHMLPLSHLVCCESNFDDSHSQHDDDHKALCSCNFDLEPTPFRYDYT